MRGQSICEEFEGSIFEVIDTTAPEQFPDLEAVKMTTGSKAEAKDLSKPTKRLLSQLPKICCRENYLQG